MPAAPTAFVEANRPHENPQAVAVSTLKTVMGNAHKHLDQCFPTTVPPYIVRGSAIIHGINK